MKLKSPLMRNFNIKRHTNALPETVSHFGVPILLHTPSSCRSH